MTGGVGVGWTTLVSQHCKAKVESNYLDQSMLHTRSFLKDKKQTKKDTLSIHSHVCL